MKLLIATHNPAKKQELGIGFSSLSESNINILYLDNLHIHSDPDETGKTFLENAKLKATFFSNISHLPTVADDGGIEIDALGGEPGVHSKRWLGRDATDEEMISFTLLKLKDVPIEKRSAQFTVCLYYYNPLTKFYTSVKESLKGYIALSPIKAEFAQRGFPYRALFIVDAYNKYYHHLTREEHAATNHRLNAIKKLIPLIKEDLLQ